MTYLLFGLQSLILKNRTNKILKENFEVLDDFNYVKIDAREVPPQDIAYEASLLPIGYEKKAVVVINPYFLSKNKEKVKYDKEPDFGALVDYINNPCEDTILIFVANYDKLDDKNEVVKALKVHATIQETKEITPEQWPMLIKKQVEKNGATIEIDATTELAERLNNDSERFITEIDKLTLYTNHITKKDVQLLVSKPVEANAFNIFESLVHSNNKEALKIYRNLLVEGSEPVQLIGLLASQFRLYSEVFYLEKCGYFQDRIASELGIHPYRVKLALNNHRFIGYKKCINTLDDLYKLDYAIKSGEASDRFYAFEMFLINFNPIK